MTIFRIDSKVLDSAKKLESDEKFKQFLRIWETAMKMYNEELKKFEPSAAWMVKCSRDLYTMCDKKLGEKGTDKEQAKALTALRKEAYDFVTKMKSLKNT